MFESSSPRRNHEDREAEKKLRNRCNACIPVQIRMFYDQNHTLKDHFSHRDLVVGGSVLENKGIFSRK